MPGCSRCLRHDGLMIQSVSSEHPEPPCVADLSGPYACVGRDADCARHICRHIRPRDTSPDRDVGLPRQSPSKDGRKRPAARGHPRLGFAEKAWMRGTCRDSFAALVQHGGRSVVFIDEIQRVVAALGESDIAYEDQISWYCAFKLH